MHFFRTYKEIITGVAMLVVVGVVLVLSVTSFAWFGHNKKVTATGESIEVEVPVCVLISSSFKPAAGQERQGTVFSVNLNDNGFAFSAGFTPSNVLCPASTVDAKNFYYPVSIEPNGDALYQQDEDTFYAVEPENAHYFFLEQKFYVCTINTEDVAIALRNVNFIKGNDASTSNLYKSVRVAVSTDGGENFTIIRCADSGENALPVSGSNTTAETDPSITPSELTSDTVSLVLPAGQETLENGIECHYREVIVRLWIEGQNENAIVAYAGTAFKVSFGFDVVK